MKQITPEMFLEEIKNILLDIEDEDERRTAFFETAMNTLQSLGYDNGVELICKDLGYC